jgi:hypothetical protein
MPLDVSPAGREFRHGKNYSIVKRIPPGVDFGISRIALSERQPVLSQPLAALCAEIPGLAPRLQNTRDLVTASWT